MVRLPREDAKDIFLAYWRMLGGETEYVCEFRFHPKRKFRFDVAFVDNKVAVEIEGGVYSYWDYDKEGRRYRRRGRHVTPSGYERDCEKYNLAATLGWRVLRYTPQMLKRNPAKYIAQIVNALELEDEEA